MRVMKMPAWFCLYSFAVLSERRGDVLLSESLYRMAILAAYKDGAFFELTLGGNVPELSCN